MQARIDTEVNWSRRVWRISGPVILSNLSIPLLGAVDTAVMGHMPGPSYVGAVAVGALIFNVFYWIFGFLRMGTTGFAAQAHGAEDAVERAAVIWRAALVGGVLGLGLIVLQWPLGLLAFAVIDPSAEVTALGERYYDLRIWGAPATLITYAISGWLLGIDRAGHVLAVQLTLNGLNIALNLFFVLGLGMTVEGVALGTVIAEYTAVTLGLVLVWRRLRPEQVLVSRHRLFARARLLALFRVNRDIMIRTACLQTAFVLFTAIGARMGDVTLAANAILINLLQFTSYGLDGFAHAAEALAGQAFGARRRSSFRRAAWVSSLWAAGAAVAVSLLFWLAGEAILSLYTNQDPVLRQAGTYMPWMVAMPLVAVASYQLDGVFIGATRTVAMRNAMIASLLVYLAVLAVAVPLWGNHGLWFSMVSLMLARAATLAVRWPALERTVEG
ncbi:MAG: MATE family efflux transporter [Pseudomonadota bacterium]|uniref:MATE family efflux transporter n=1 Tax=Fodinicurvata fenggangensis TaxID=1121830 RepID=UPI000A752337|nr:MATE family efflux transporter [Fodinicurvata fenggangensis]